MGIYLLFHSKVFWKFCVMGPQFLGFQTRYACHQIVTVYGVPFHAVVVFGPSLFWFFFNWSDHKYCVRLEFWHIHHKLISTQYHYCHNVHLLMWTYILNYVLSLCHLKILSNNLEMEQPRLFLYPENEFVRIFQF